MSVNVPVIIKDPDANMLSLKIITFTDSCILIGFLSRNFLRQGIIELWCILQNKPIICHFSTLNFVIKILFVTFPTAHLLFFVKSSCLAKFFVGNNIYTL